MYTHNMKSSLSLLSSVVGQLNRNHIHAQTSVRVSIRRFNTTKWQLKEEKRNRIGKEIHFTNLTLAERLRPLLDRIFVVMSVENANDGCYYLLTIENPLKFTAFNCFVRFMNMIFASSSHFVQKENVYRNRFQFGYSYGFNRSCCAPAFTPTHTRSLA